MIEVTKDRITDWIETNLMPKISKSLGKSDKNVRCDISFPQNSFFVSCVCFVDLTFEPEGNNTAKNSEDKLRLVIKRPPLDDELVKRMNMTVHFHNEILFYTKFARDNSRFPRCIFVLEDKPDNTVIVTENMSPHGYDVCPESYDVPVEYVFSAMNEIAKLHAMGYVMKETEPEEFKRFVDDIGEARFVPGGWMNEFLNVVTSRSVPWLRRNDVDPKFCDRIQRHFDNTFDDIMLPAVKPLEPLATICHGDFTRNNIFFRKIDDRLEAMLIDFALIGYSSPAIDISTFLYLNCSTADRTSKFGDIFRSYHDALIGYLRDAGISDLEKYSYDNMLAEYKRSAVFGYVITVFFLPIIVHPDDVDHSDVNRDPKYRAMIFREIGGEAMDRLLGKMILELRDMGCFDHLC